MVADITMAELKMVVAETSVAVKKLSENSAEIKRELAEKLAESQKNTELALQEMLRETHRVMQETRLEMQRDQQEFRLEMQRDSQEFRHEMLRVVQESRLDMQRDLQETQRVLKTMMKELSGNIGGVNRRLGEIVELVVLPGLINGMNDFGHKFTMSSPRKKFSKNGKQIAEVDLLLENGEEVMVVEVKSRFKTGDMKDFLEQLELLRKHEKITGMAGKTIYAAAAGIGFEPEARKIALGKGIYLVNIKMDYDNEKLKITSPPKRKIGKW